MDLELDTFDTFGLETEPRPFDIINWLSEQSDVIDLVCGGSMEQGLQMLSDGRPIPFDLAQEIDNIRQSLQKLLPDDAPSETPPETLEPLPDNRSSGSGHVVAVKPKKAQKRQPKRQAKPQLLNYSFIRDDRLGIKDRVVFSYLRKLDRLEKNGKQPKRCRRRIEKFTGYDHRTASQVLTKLQSLGYIDPAWRTLKEFKCKVFVRDSNDAVLLRSIINKNWQNGRKVGASWAAKACGISRPTYYRWMANVVK